MKDRDINPSYLEHPYSHKHASPPFSMHLICYNHFKLHMCLISSMEPTYVQEKLCIPSKANFQADIYCSKLAIETLEQGVKHVQS